MTWTPDNPYDDLPDLPPTIDLETKSVLKAVTEARSKLAALDATCQSLPNPDILLNAITLLEAQASSEVENIVTTTDDLFWNAQRKSEDVSDPAVREALQYRTALQEGFENVRTRGLTARVAQNVCATIMLHDMRIRDLPGTYIGSPGNSAPIYTPPTGKNLIQQKLQAWETFLHSDSDLDPLLKMSLAHYQFEAIHPFSDGNGRTGRILNILTLASEGLLQQPILYLSKYIIENKGAYYDNLLNVTRQQDWESWNLYMIKGVAETAANSLQRARSIYTLQQEFADHLRATFKRVDADLLNLLFFSPLCHIANVQSACSVSRITATNMLEKLVAQNLLIKRRRGRHNVYINFAFMQILRENIVPTTD